jgi:hypothetical protein
MASARTCQAPSQVCVGGHERGARALRFAGRSGSATRGRSGRRTFPTQLSEKSRRQGASDRLRSHSPCAILAMVCLSQERADADDFLERPITAPSRKWSWRGLTVDSRSGIERRRLGISSRRAPGSLSRRCSRFARKRSQRAALRWLQHRRPLAANRVAESCSGPTWPDRTRRAGGGRVP